MSSPLSKKASARGCKANQTAGPENEHLIQNLKKQSGERSATDLQAVQRMPLA
jgi:hypothetical protein